MTSAEDIPILYQDDRVCAVAKPTAIMVHRSGISTDRVFLDDRLREQLGRRVWTVHRLDRATSGVLLIALDRDAAGDLGRQFQAGTIGKRYVAVVRGWVDDTGTVDKPLRASRGREQQAVTAYRCLARTELPVPVPPHDTSRYSLVEVAPQTGRMHQIRRHFNHIAHPIVGDVSHGDRRHNRVFRARFGCHRLLLHASRLRFEHPGNGREIVVRCAPPDDFSSVARALGWGDALRADPADGPSDRCQPRFISTG